MTALELPADDRALSPYTGYTRAHWAAIADHLLLSLRPYFSTTRARVQVPGPVSSSGAGSDGLEGFARSFLLFGFRLVGEAGHDPHEFGPWYRDGLIAGTDPGNSERWPLPGELPQAKVEAASIALILQLTRPWLWDTLKDGHQQQVINWLTSALDGWYPANNWLWFRVTIETFLSSVGGPYRPSDITADLDLFESFYREAGWYSDGADRSYDYYCGWALHLYPLLWCASNGAAPFGARELEPVWRGRLAEFLDDYVELIGSRGIPVIAGRSLIYRFASAAPLWMGAYTGATSLSPGTIRRATSGILRGFVDRGGIEESGLLSMGFFHAWPGMAQSYSGAGPPYWASKGMLGLALPADHPVWTAHEEPLPLEQADTRRVIGAAGWLLSGTKRDGIVRLYNHGSDHASPGDSVTDSPLYARLGYSTETVPPLTGMAVESPADNTVGAVDARGRLTHRSGFTLVRSGDDGAAAFAVSVADTHWVDVTDDIGRDHGAGRVGDITAGPRLALASLVRGAWEVRVAHVLSGSSLAADSGEHRIRVSGWPLAGAAEARADAAPPSSVMLRLDQLRSGLTALVGQPTDARTHVERGTSPLGDVTTVPVIEFDAVRAGDTIAVAVYMGGTGRGGGSTAGSDSAAAGDSAPGAKVSRGQGGAISIQVTWHDGPLSAVTLPAY